MRNEFDLSVQELQKSCEGMKKELFNLKMNLYFGKKESSARVKLLRRAIARAKTIIHSKKNGGEVE